MFSSIKEKLKKIYTSITSPFQSLFSQKKIDEQTLLDLKKILIESDAGYKTTQFILNKLQDQYKTQAVSSGIELEKELKSLLHTILSAQSFDDSPNIILLLGINGSGKTTLTGKLAYLHHLENKKCLIVGADTFRAAAREQIEEWAKRANSTFFSPTTIKDPSAVVFAACEKFKNEHFDTLIIDTAGRLQTKQNLMKELTKIKSVITKQLPSQKISTLLTLDAMLGQNSFEQAELFHEATELSGVVITKLDGTGKGGIIFSIVRDLNLPVAYISYGEKIQDIKKFIAKEYIDSIL